MMKTKSKSGGEPDGGDIALRRPVPSPYFDAVIEKGIVFLLIFTPLAFGSVQQWAVSVMETSSFIVFGAWLLKQSASRKFEFYLTPILYFVFALAVVAVIQIIPLPPRLLGIVSSSTMRVYRAFFDDNGTVWRTISIAPQSTMDELWKLLSYAAVFTVIINHWKTRAQAAKTYRLIVWIGLFIAVFAVAQKMTWNGRLYWIYPVRSGLTSTLSHIWGPYINRNHFAGYMELAVPLALGLLLYRLMDVKMLPGLPFKRRLVVYANNNAIVPMISLSVSALVMAGVMFMTLSRGGAIGLAAGVIVFMFMSLKSRSLKKKAGLLAMLGAALLLVIVMLSWSRLENRFSDIADEEKTARIDLWADSVNMAMDFPVLGTGLGTFKLAYPSYQTKHSALFFDHMENDFLGVLTETGAVGAVAAVGIIFFFFYPVVQVWRVRRNTFVKCMAAAGVASCAALFAHSFTDFNMRIPANAMLITVIAAVTYATVFNVSDRGSLRVIKNARP